MLVVIDLQDAGVRFYTYETVMGYFLEAARSERERGHALEVMVLDRPAMIGRSGCTGACLRHGCFLHQLHAGAGAEWDDSGRTCRLYAA